MNGPFSDEASAGRKTASECEVNSGEASLAGTGKPHYFSMQNSSTYPMLRPITHDRKQRHVREENKVVAGKADLIVIGSLHMAGKPFRFHCHGDAMRAPDAA